MATSGDRMREGFSWDRVHRRPQLAMLLLLSQKQTQGAYEAALFFRLIKVSMINHAFTFSRAGVVDI